MGNFKSNMDKMLYAVLLNENLMKFGEYEEKDCVSIDMALLSDNKVVRTVAQIIKSYNEGNSTDSIYKEIANYLKQNV